MWDVVTVDQSKPYAITGAPRIAKGMVLIGNAGSEFGVRGCVSAYDAETGKLIWRTFTRFSEQFSWAFSFYQLSQSAAV